MVNYLTNILNPTDKNTGDAIGGDAYWATGLSFMSNLPGKPHWPLKPHFYINAGRLGTVDRCEWKAARALEKV
jgi:outer membrane protein insertion porin family